MDGDGDLATAGDGDLATAGDGDLATAGDGDLATAGDGESATAGDGLAAGVGDGEGVTPVIGLVADDVSQLSCMEYAGTPATTACSRTFKDQRMRIEWQRLSELQQRSAAWIP